MSAATKILTGTPPLQVQIPQQHSLVGNIRAASIAIAMDGSQHGALLGIESTGGAL
jgi:hypothetical protein